jgi:hypothetical protein
MTSPQFPPAGDPNVSYGVPSPIVQQPAAPFASSGPPGGRRTGLLAVGALILAAGIAAGVVMLLASGKNYEDGVQNLARAPIGCTTSLEFDESGTFTLYIETVGSIGDVRGDCPGTGTDFEYTGTVVPAVDIVLVDEEGADVDLDADETKDYDAGGSAGQSIFSVEIDEPGDYEITVTSADTDFAISIGKNPKDSADSLRTTGLIALIAGVVVGGALLFLGLRRRSTTPPPAPPYGSAPSPFDTTAPTVSMPPVVGWPTAPVPPSPGPPSPGPPSPGPVAPHVPPTAPPPPEWPAPPRT